MKRIQELTDKIAAVSRETAAPIIRDFIREHQPFPLQTDGACIFFFYDEGNRIDAVHLIHWVFGLESRQAFFPIGETGAWYLPLELPARSRVEYKLEIARKDQRLWVRDPLNPRKAQDPFGSNSVCPMAGYEEPRWAFPEVGVRPGARVAFEIDSEVWGDKREIQVYLPVEYKPRKKYPLLICHDGRDYLRFANIKTVLDNLIQRHEVAPLLVAFTSGSSDRNREYGANPKQAAFIVDEMLPAVKQRFGVVDDPREIGLMGASFGGVSSLYTAWSRPGVFGKLLLQSGSFVFTDIGRHDRGPLFDPVVQFVNAYRADPARVDAKIFLSCGQFESLIWFNRGLFPLMRDAGLDVRFVEAQDGHNWIAWRDRLREALTWLYPGHLWMVYD